LVEIQQTLFSEAKTRMNSNIVTGLTKFSDVADYFGAEEDEGTGGFRGWVRAPWCRASGAELEKIEDQLKALKLTFRNVPLDSEGASGKCIFTGADGVEDILIARSY